jgi:hypothetical protein
MGLRDSRTARGTTGSSIAVRLRSGPSAAVVILGLQQVTHRNVLEENRRHEGVPELIGASLADVTKEKNIAIIHLLCFCALVTSRSQTVAADAFNLRNN